MINLNSSLYMIGKFIAIISLIVFGLAILWGRSKMKKIPGVGAYLTAWDIYNAIMLIPVLILFASLFMYAGETTWFPDY